MKTEALEGEVIDRESGGMILSGSEAMIAQTTAEIDMLVSTAKRYPRSVKAFKDQCEQLACLDEETAQTMFYSLPRSGKTIQGPSVRFAEVVGYSWGNLRYGARVVAVDDKFITAQGMCNDLEKNIAASVEVKRRITSSNGKRYNDDMITVTGNAACSIALRNAIFKVVPFGMAKSVYEKALDIVKGDAKSLVERRDSALAWFAKVGATEAQVLQALGRASIEEITVDDFVTMTGFRNAIKDGEAAIEEVLGPVPDQTKRVKRSELNDKIKPAAKQESQPDDSDKSDPLFLEETEAAFKACVDAPMVESIRGKQAMVAQTNHERQCIAKWADEAKARIGGKK